MLAFKSCGASLATLIEFYNIDSGMISISGRGGGSEETKHLKLGWTSSHTISRFLSNTFIHVYIKCTFCNIIQWPFFPASYRALIAISSYPCPIEILTKLPSDIDTPFFRPTLSTSGVGSTPGKSTKNIGVEGLISE